MGRQDGEVDLETGAGGAIGGADALAGAGSSASGGTGSGSLGPPVGKRYAGGTWTVDRAAFQAYADATDDDNPAYRGDDAVAPPMFHVRLVIDLMMTFARDPELELDLLRLVHGEHAMTFHRPLRPGDEVQIGGELLSLVDKASGRVATFSLSGTVGGARAFEGTTTYFIRGEKKPGSGKKKPPPEAPPPPDLTVAQPVASDQATRYAQASGDLNPIHTDPEVARAAGLPGVILHGLCTMAFAGRDLVNRCCDGDPRRLAALSVRFARPVFPGETLTLKVWEADDELAFQTDNAKGQAVIVGGRARIRPAEVA